MKSKDLHPDTLAIRVQAERSAQKENSSAIYLTSSFQFDDAEEMRAVFADEQEGNIYSRFINPNCTELVQKLCALEGAEDGYSTASGMAAVFASFMAFLKAGDHIISSKAIFGSTYTVLTKYLPKWDIKVSFADGNDNDSWEKLIRPETKIIFIETPSNPGLDVIDIESLSSICKKSNIILIVDNCFATPFITRPIELGADLVVHSATKYIDGQGRVLGGVVVGKKELIKEIYLMCRSTGPALSPFNAWVLSKSMETLSVRMERHCSNALKIAEFLSANSNVSNVRYPHLPSHPQHEIAKRQMKSGGALVAFEIRGGLDAGRKFLDALQLCTLTANLGDTRTIISHPASTTHSRMSEEERLQSGITQGLIRVSAGLEFAEDIITDIQQALERSQG